jgi:Uma2 family endonuclease
MDYALRSVPFPPMTEADYFALDAASPLKHEFVNGEVYSMAGASERHNTIAGNLFVKLHTAHGRGACRPFMGDMRLRLARSTSTYYYPDVMLVCDPLDADPLMKTLPCLVAEVTSPSTEGTDRREKLAAYLAMPSLREYLILSHIEARVDLYQRGDSGDGADPQWRYSCLRGEDSFALTCLDLTLTVPELFAGVRFEPVVDLDAL